MQQKISVIIPVFNEEYIIRTLSTLRSQPVQDFEVVVVDDHSTDGTHELLEKFSKEYPLKLLRNPRNMGPAVSRNIGVKNSHGDIIAFTDSDCLTEFKWVERIAEAFNDPDVDVVMGKVIIPKSTFLGDCISALGFPGGGAVGFEKMWHVTEDGFTTQVVTCNCAFVRKNVFHKIGYFDESFPYPFGEDTEFSQRLLRSGIKIKYCPEIRVYHRPRTDVGSFVKWAFNRGKGKYYLKQRVDLGDFVKLRVWSTKNILRMCWGDVKFPVILVLLGSYFVLQEMGYFFERVRQL